MSTSAPNEPQSAGSPSPNGTAMKTEPFAPIACSVRIVRDSANLLGGKILAQVAPQGLILYPPGQQPTVVKPGSKVKYLGENRLAVTLTEPNAQSSTERELSMRLQRPGAYASSLALDTVAYLNGDIPKLNASYNIPLYLFLPALLPLGLPLLGYLYLVDGKITARDRIYELIGLGVGGIMLSALCLFIAFSEKTKEYIRLLACLLFTGLAYLGVAMLVNAIPTPNIYMALFGRDPFQPPITWKMFDLPEEDIRRISAYDAPVAVGSIERDMSRGHKTTFKRYEMRTAPEADFFLEVALVPDEVYGTYLLEEDLLRRNFEEDFPGIAEVSIRAIENDVHRTQDDYFIPGKELRGELNGMSVIRQIFIMKDRVYILTVQAKKAPLPRNVHENYFGSLAIHGMKEKRDVPVAAAGGGGPPTVNATRATPPPTSTSTRPKPTFPKPTDAIRAAPGSSGGMRPGGGGGRRGGGGGRRGEQLEEEPASTKPAPSAPAPSTTAPTAPAPTKGDS